jgi:Malectin domain
VKSPGVNSDSACSGADSNPAASLRAEQSELEAVLKSRTFVRSPNLAAILKYVCQEYLEGRTDKIKEYNIAVEALGRTQDFDPSHDSAVRVEVSRLRKRLQQYYESEGAAHALHLHLADFGYVPRFVRQPPPGDPRPQAVENAAELASGEVAGGESAGGEIADGESAALEPAGPEAHADQPKPRLAVVVLSALAIVLAGVIVTILVRGRSENAHSAAPMAASVVPVVGGAAEALRISVGSLEPKYLDRSGQVWLGDRYFTGGAVIEKPDRTIFRTLDPALYRKGREGDCQYDIPLKPGVYELHLHFAELARRGISGITEENERVFAVSMNGTPILPFFDIVGDAPGSETADERVFKDVSPAPDGRLHLRFSSLTNSPLLSGIEVLPGILHRMLPVRILTGYRTFYDRKGQFWGADRYFWGGHTILSRYPVTAADEPALYSGDRYGNFTYYIPVPTPGRYAVTLRFAETYFGKETTDGLDRRVFDVYCNGTTLLNDFDLLKENGAPCVAVKKTFHHLKPNAQGKLVLSFVPVTSYATVRAIEVEDETP